MKVVDASVIAKFILKEKNWENLISVLKGSSTLELAINESTNAIWKAFYRELISEKDATEKLRALILLMESIEVRKSLNFLEDGLKISIKHKIPIYDSLYIAFALKEGKELYTCDNMQYKVSLKEGIRCIRLD